MRLGTKSLLFGCHQFVLHPLCVAVAWTKLYGFPRDPRLWVAFVVHDWGYRGLNDIDGTTGWFHPTHGGWLMRRWFGPDWGHFTATHSRTFAEFLGEPVSRLAVADKLATLVMPRRLFLTLGRLSGELHEYMTAPKYGPAWTDVAAWYDHLYAFSVDWILHHETIATPEPPSCA